MTGEQAENSFPKRLRKRGLVVFGDEEPPQKIFNNGMLYLFVL